MAFKVGDICRVIEDCDGEIPAGSIVEITIETNDIETGDAADSPMCYVRVLLGESRLGYATYPMYLYELDLITQEPHND